MKREENQEDWLFFTTTIGYGELPNYVDVNLPMICKSSSLLLIPGWLMIAQLALRTPHAASVISGSFPAA